MAESLTLVIETNAGTAIRRIPDVSPLLDGKAQGYAAEDAIHTAASTWGMPDFVFLPEQQRDGSKVRELGDGLLLVGGYAAVLQSKSRTDPTDRPERELSWLTRNIAKALRQGSGTVRRLKVTAAEMTNCRRRTVSIDGNRYTWLTVVIIDHADPPRGFQPPAAPTAVPAVVILRRDWEFLFDHLQSTGAVLAYLLRVARTGEVISLGDEPRRFHEYALADLDAAPDQVHPLISKLVEAKPTSVISTARAPLDPAGDDDQSACTLFRMIMEDIANTRLPAESEPDRLLMLAALDGLPVAYRSELGRALLEFMSSAAQHTGSGTLTHSRTLIPNPSEFDPLVFVVASKHSEEANHALMFRMQVLHHDYSTAVGDWDHCTLGVMLTPSTVPGLLWDTSTTALWGDQGQPPEFIEELRTFIARNTT